MERRSQILEKFPEKHLQIHSIRNTERCVSGGHQKGAKNCDCREKMQTEEFVPDNPTLCLIDGAPRTQNEKTKAAVGTFDFVEARSKRHDINNPFEPLQEGDYEVVFKLARIAQYLRSEPRSDKVQWEALLEYAYKSVRFFPSINQWLREVVKKKNEKPDYKSLTGFIARFASYGADLINGQATECEGFKRRVPFGSIGLPRLGSREWIVIRSDEQKMGKLLEGSRNTRICIVISSSMDGRSLKQFTTTQICTVRICKLHVMFTDDSASLYSGTAMTDGEA